MLLKIESKLFVKRSKLNDLFNRLNNKKKIKKSSSDCLLNFVPITC